MDKYDEAIAYLTEHPSKIQTAWNWPDDDLYGDGEINGGCLFQIVGDYEECGCLTQIRLNPYRIAPTAALTDAIRADERIPKSPEQITIADLPVFAEWQRRLDKELNRV